MSEGRIGKGGQCDLQADLLAGLDAETWLLERLKAHGIDPYAPAGPFDGLADRLAYVIAANRYGPVVAGRHQGKPETYEQFVLRAFGIKLKDVPRDTVSNTKQSTG